MMCGCYIDNFVGQDLLNVIVYHLSNFNCLRLLLFVFFLFCFLYYNFMKEFKRLQIILKFLVKVMIKTSCMLCSAQIVSYVPYMIADQIMIHLVLFTSGNWEIYSYSRISSSVSKILAWSMFPYTYQICLESYTA